MISKFKKIIDYSDIKLKVSNIHRFWRFFKNKLMIMDMIYIILITNCIRSEVIRCFLILCYAI